MVCMGNSTVVPMVASVTLNHFQAMHSALSYLAHLGYKRPGCVISAPDDARDAHRWRCLFELCRVLGEPADPLVYDKMSVDVMANWLKQQNPDIVFYIGTEWNLCLLTGAGYRVPEDLGFCCMDLFSPNSTTTGIYQRRGEIGKVAVDMLHSLLLRNERGIPAEPHEVQVSATWCPGTTVRWR